MSQLQSTQTTANLLGRVARATSVVMVLFVASRALGLLREVVIAHQFGAGAEMDAYLAAFRVPDFLFYVVAGGALGSAFIPTFAGYLSKSDLDGAWRLASAVINWMTLILSLLAGMAAIFTPWLVQTFYGDFSPSQQLLTAELMRWMLISTVIFGVSGVIMGILNAHQHFLLPAFAPIIYNLALIAGAWFLGPVWGVRGLVVGVVVGAAGHLLVQIPGLIQARMRYRPVLVLQDPALREVGRLMGPRVLGLAAVQLNFVATTILASSLPVGSLTALNYGWIIMLLPQGVVAQSVATALFPTLAALVARGEQAQMRHIFITTLRNLLFLTLPASAGLIVLRDPLVRLLLERGNFGSEATAATAWALGFFALGLVGHAVVEIVARAFYALKNTRTPVGIGVLAMALNIVLSLLLIDLFEQIGWSPHGGLALANSLAVIAEMIVLLWLLGHRLGGLGEPGFARSLIMMSLATAGMVLVLLLAIPFLPDQAWQTGLIGLVIGGVVYIGLAQLLDLDEWRVIRQRLMRRRRSSG